MWPEAGGMPNQTAETCAETFIDVWVTRHGVPVRVVTDLGGQFSKTLANTVARLLGYSQSFTAPYTPQTNAKVERFHRTLRAFLRLQVLEYGGDWEKYLQSVLFAVRTSRSRSHGESPFYVLRGVHPRLPSDAVTGFAGIPRSPEQVGTNIVARVAEAQRKARVIRNQYDSAPKEQCDKGKREVVFKPGEQVLMQHLVYQLLISTAWPVKQTAQRAPYCNFCKAAKLAESLPLGPQ